MGILVPNEVFWGERLQLAREFRGLTQTDLGNQVAASCSLISLCENGKKRDPAPDLVEACGAVLGFDPTFFYGPVEDAFREDECSFRHRRTTPERVKTQIRAHATLIGIVIRRLRSLFKFPELDLPKLSASTGNELEMAAEHCRSEEHTSELQSQFHLVCRLLLEKKKKTKKKKHTTNKQHAIKKKH